MQKHIKLDGGTCRIAKNGDLSFVPPSRYIIYLLIACAGLLGAWLWAKELEIIVAFLLLVSAVVVLVRWTNQPIVQITGGSGMIKWRMWFRSRQCSFDEVARIDIFLDQQVESLEIMQHHGEAIKKTVILYAQLELILKDGSRLPLGKITGEYAKGRVVSLARSLAGAISVPVTSAGNISLF